MERGRSARMRNAHKQVCQLVYDRYLYWSDDLSQWRRDCFAESAALGDGADPQYVASLLNLRLRVFGVSHLAVFAPVEGMRLMSGVSLDTGLRLKTIEDELVVVKVFAESPAFDAGVRRGDILERVNGSESFSTYAVPFEGGRFDFLRAGRRRTVELRPREVRIDGSPRWSRLDAQTGLLEISSFRDDYFDQATWRRLAAEAAGFSRMVVDVRGNVGGNFVAMLRALSTFLCEPTVVGEVHQPRLENPTSEALRDDLDADDQVYQFDRISTLRLETFAGYGCFTGPLAVLFNSDTASVSEILVEALRTRARTRLIGQRTNGEVVMASYYRLPLLGPGYSVSIPEAIYRTTDGRILEGQGVEPHVDVREKLSDALRGGDTFIEVALQQLSTL
jgi:carboxyl-terminal processing protease